MPLLRVTVCHSVNGASHIDEVTPRRAWLVLGWVTVRMQPATQTNLAPYCRRFGKSSSWWRSTAVERRSLTGELSLSCARPAADG